VSRERLGEIVAGIAPADVSTLMALRALVGADDGVDAVDRARWMTALREEYNHWYGGSNGQSPENFAGPESQRYLDEHVVRQLASGGAVEFLGEDGETVASPERVEAGSWSAVRVASWALDAAGERALLLGYIDSRIRSILHPEQSAPQPVASGDWDDGGGAMMVASPSDDGYDGYDDHDDQGDRYAGTAAAGPQRRKSMLVPGGQTLAAKGLVKTYRGRRVVNEVDIHVSQGEIVGLLGPNGAGKTTSFYMITGLIRPDKGRVFVAERELTRVPMFKRARAGIGYLAQEPSIFRKLTVEENVMAILQMMKIPRAERKRRLETLLDELSIKHLRKTRAYALSGGERRRLEITRALVSEPRFMLLDEPFAGVDPIAVHDIQQIVSDLRRRGIGVLISDHNVEQTLDIVDRAYIMYEGKVRVSGTVGELVWNDEVAEIYLGPTLTARMRERYSNPQGDDAV
jgi:lipopolysaccharide export system ATP-binding protein